MEGQRVGQTQAEQVPLPTATGRLDDLIPGFPC